MLALRYVYVLALVVWLGGLFGALLERFAYQRYAAGGILLITLVLMAVLGPRPRAFAVRVALVTIMLGIALYSAFIPGTIDAIHTDSLMTVNIVGALALLYWEARDHGQ